MLCPNAISQQRAGREHNDPEQRSDDTPVELGKLVHRHIQSAPLGFGQRRRFVMFCGFGKFQREFGLDGLGIQLDQRGVGADKSADINRSGKNIVVPLFEGANVVAADFCNLRNLVDREVSGLARLAQLLGNR